MTRKLNLAFLALVLATGLRAQHSPPKSDPAEISKLFYNASGDAQYICYAQQKKITPSYVKRTDSTLTSIGVATNVATATTASAHNLYVGARVVVSGATVDTDLNATYTILTVPTSTTYTFATVSVADATYNESTLQIGTYYPLFNEYLWAIQVFTYNATPAVDGVLWAATNVGYTMACSDRSSY